MGNADKERAPPSDFYEPRRAAFRQASGHLGFVTGFLGSALIAWGFLRAGLARGDAEIGMFQFLLIVFGAGVAGALGGGVLGHGLGGLWEYQHRRRRVRSARVMGSVVPVPVPGERDQSMHDETAASAFRAPPPELDFRDVMDVDAFLALAQRVWPRGYDRQAAASALARTVNIGAWEGLRLVGSVRVLTDGYFFATVPEILVDPDYQRRGIGRALMGRALSVSPRGTLFFGAQAPSVAFFERLGCERGPIGFVMREKPVAE
jgi:GNAT superfamily N-acetyltransferase